MNERSHHPYRECPDHPGCFGYEHCVTCARPPQEHDCFCNCHDGNYADGQPWCLACTSEYSNMCTAGF